jgi:hypothetical protein
MILSAVLCKGALNNQSQVIGRWRFKKPFQLQNNDWADSHDFYLGAHPPNPTDKSSLSDNNNNKTKTPARKQENMVSFVALRVTKKVMATCNMQRYVNRQIR